MLPNGPTLGYVTAAFGVRHSVALVFLVPFESRGCSGAIAISGAIRCVPRATLLRLLAGPPVSSLLHRVPEAGPWAWLFLSWQSIPCIRLIECEHLSPSLSSIQLQLAKVSSNLPPAWGTNHD